jgi:putative transposase
MGRGYMYLLAIIDLHSRYIVGWSLSNTMEASWVVDVLKEAVENHGKPEIINSDQGSQFTSEVYLEYVKSLETVSISMDGKGRATANAYIERFFRTLKYDRLYLIGVEDAHELFKECRAFIHFYNNRRGHSSLKYRTPNEVFMKAA